MRGWNEMISDFFCPKKKSYAENFSKLLSKSNKIKFYEHAFWSSIDFEDETSLK